MGRFYQTAQPQFVEDIMFQPPWQLAAKALETKQKGYDNALESTELVRNLLDVEHLNFDKDKVKEIKNKYNTKVDDIVDQISKDPNNYNKMLPAIKKLSREIGSDRQEGDISSITRRATDWKKWMEDNKDLSKTDTDTYNKLADHWYKDISSRSQEDINATFSGKKGIARPDINSKEMLNVLKEFKENATEVSNGRYKINNKWLTEDEVAQAAYDIYMSNPNIQGYLNQQGNILKDPGFYDESTGKLKNIFEVVDGKRVLNPTHSLSSGFRGIGNVFGFREQSIEEDKYGVQAQGNANARALQAQRDAEAMKRLMYTKGADKQKLIDTYALKTQFERDKLKMQLEEEGENGDQAAQEALKHIYSKETLGIIKNPDYNYEDDFNKIKNNREASTVPNDGGTYFSTVPGTSAYQENYRLKKATNFAKSKLGNNKEVKEYLEFLGENRPTEETAKQFLRSKGVYQRPSFETSIAGKFADESRSKLLNPLKSDAAKKWDKIYEIGEKYEDHIKDWYEEESRKQVQVSVNPIDEKGNEILLGELNTESGRNNYYTTDEKGNPTGEKLDIKQVLGVTGGNNQSNIGFQVLTFDDEIKWMFPSVDNKNIQELSRNLSLMAVKDKNSAFAKETMNQEVNRITTEINKGIDVGGTKSNIVSVLGSNIVVKTTPDGKIEVYDENGNEKAGTWSSVSQLVEYLYK